MQPDGFAATVTYHAGVFTLYMRSTERSRIWDNFDLPGNYNEALEMVDKYLENFPKPLVDKVKQRLNKFMEIRKLELEMSKSEKREVPVSEKSFGIKLLQHLKRNMENGIRRIREQPTIIYGEDEEEDCCELDSEEEDDDEEARKAGPLKDAEYDQGDFAKKAKTT